jgi:hypothetical protein
MTDESNRLATLRDAVREDDVLADPRWEAYALGELSADQERALRQRARDAGLGDEIFSTLRPLDQGKEKKLVDAALRKLHPPNRRIFPAIVGALALAAGLVLVQSWPRPEHGPLAMYSPEIHGGQRDTRSLPEGLAPVERFVPGGRIEIVARPNERMGGPVEARAFLVREGTAERWNVPIAIAEGGAVRIAGTFEDLFGTVAVGRSELVIAISRPGALPDEKTLAHSAEGVRIIRQPIEIAGAAR